MAIYKLDGICTSIRGNCSFQKKDIIDEESDHSYVALHYGKTYKVSVVDNSFSYYVSNDFYKENQIVRKHDTVLVSTSETLDDLGHSYLYNRDDFGLLGGEQILLQANENIIIKKYLYYLSLGLKQQLKTYATGLKVYRFKKEDFRNINVVVPSIKEQQAIIDIIRPFEEMETLYKTIDDKISCIENSIICSSSVTEQKFTFIKGGLPNKQEGPTMFLNVAAANGNPNRYVSNNPNVFIGDVTLSLDGNCGLVNNTLEGFNGYLYKVEVDNVDPWQIYYSLKTKYSQNIIKLNETGTTIKHAPGAKKELRLHTFEHSEYLKYLYMLRVQLHKNREIIVGNKKNLVKLLIK